MKLIDKYIMRCFMAPLGYVFMGFTMIFVVWDLFDHMGDFMKNDTSILNILQYYLFWVLSMMVYIIPVSILLAVLYSLWQLTKNNELTAMRASGISLYRLVIPLIMLGMGFSLFVTLVNETVGPLALTWTEKFIADMETDEQIDVNVSNQVALMNRKQYREWFIDAFNTITFDMEGVTLKQHRADWSEEYEIRARKSAWVDGSWWFSDLNIQRYDEWGNPRGAPEQKVNLFMDRLNETPQDFINTTKNPAFMSALELIEYIRMADLTKEARARYMTDFHRRLALPWTCLVVALLGIPFGTHTARKGALFGIIMCLLLFFAYYILIYVGIAMGKRGTIPPYVAGWLPNVLFLLIGSFFVRRMR